MRDPPLSIDRFADSPRDLASVAIRAGFYHQSQDRLRVRCAHMEEACGKLPPESVPGIVRSAELPGERLGDARPLDTGHIDLLFPHDALGETRCQLPQFRAGFRFAQ